MVNGVVSCDLDGTIIENSGVIDAIRRHIRRYSDGNSGECLQSVVEEHRRQLAHENVKAYDWDGIVNECLSLEWAYGESHGGDLTDEVEEVYRSHPPRLCDVGWVQWLSAVQACNSRVVLVTNGFTKFQEAALRAVNIADLFDSVVSPVEAGVIKPGPEIFRAAYGEARGAVHIGDRVIDDVVGANAVGAKSVLYAPEAPVHGKIKCMSAQDLGMVDQFLSRKVEEERGERPNLGIRYGAAVPEYIVWGVMDLWNVSVSEGLM